MRSYVDQLLLRPIRSADDLLTEFRSAEKPSEAFRVGTEMEKPGVLADGSPVRYSGDKGIVRVLDHLTDRHGWVSEPERPGGPKIALLRGKASVTLEPGGQLELSGAPVETIHETAIELREHMQELKAISSELGIRWLGIGFHPFAAREDFEWIPKDRYRFMREYLPTRGAFGLDMMLRTSTVQGNFDYSSEADALRKMKLALQISPLVTAMFANSPFLEGKDAGCVSYRARVWLDVDPDRSGLIERIWKKDAKYTDYVEWALDAPMFLFRRGEKLHVNTGQTFRSFWKNGFEGEVATLADWQMHLNTLFPEVRLKRTIEVRGADAQGLDLSIALPALWTGILNEDAALARAEELCVAWSFEEVSKLRTRVWKDGLRAEFLGKSVRSWAEMLLGVARDGLARRARKDLSGRGEEQYLVPLENLVSAGKTPADLLRETCGAGRREEIIQAAGL